MPKLTNLRSVRPAGAVTLRQIVAACRACAFVRSRTDASPRHVDTTAGDARPCVDAEGWIHDHPVTPQTEALADDLFLSQEPAVPAQTQGLS